LPNPAEIRIGTYRFDPVSRDLRDATGGRVKLRNKASETLACLAARPGEIIPKSAILETVWPGLAVTDESLT